MARGTRTAVVAKPQIPSGVIGIATPSYGALDTRGAIVESLFVSLSRQGAHVGIDGTPNAHPSAIPASVLDADIDVAITAFPVQTWQPKPRRQIGVACESTDFGAAWETGLGRVDVVACPSEWVRAKAADVIGDRAKLVRPVIFSDLYTHELRERTAPRVLFSCESLSDPRANVHTAVDAFKAAFCGVSDARMVVRSIERTPIDFADPRIGIITGVRTEADEVAIARSCDVLLYTSRAEAYPWQAIRAMALGLSVVHTGQTGMADFADLGTIVPTFDRVGIDGNVTFDMYPDALVDSLRTLARNSGEALAAAIDDAAAIAERFGKNANVDALLSLFA